MQQPQHPMSHYHQHSAGQSLMPPQLVQEQSDVHIRIAHAKSLLVAQHTSRPQTLHAKPSAHSVLLMEPDVFYQEHVQHIQPKLYVQVIIVFIPLGNIATSGAR